MEEKSKSSPTSPDSWADWAKTAVTSTAQTLGRKTSVKEKKDEPLKSATSPARSANPVQPTVKGPSLTSQSGVASSNGPVQSGLANHASFKGLSLSSGPADSLFAAPQPQPMKLGTKTDGWGDWSDGEGWDDPKALPKPLVPSKPAPSKEQWGKWENNWS